MEQELRDNIPFFPAMQRDFPNVVSHIQNVIIPRMHENRVSPVGSVVCDLSELPENFHTKFRSGNMDFADGRHTFLLVQPNNSAERFIVMSANLTLEQMVELSLERRILFVRRDQNDTVEIIWRGHVVFEKNRKWRILGPWLVVSDVLERRDIHIRQRLLRELIFLAYYQLSPRHIGCTLIVWINNSFRDEGDGKDGILKINSGNKWALISLLQQNDGATHISPEGYLISWGDKLRYTAKSESLLPDYQGTRHTSSRRFSYDNPNCIVITVSEAGPVSIFSDGLEIVTLGIPGDFSLDENKDGDPEGDGKSTGQGSEIILCEGCGKHNKYTYIATNAMDNLDGYECRCELCGHELCSTDEVIGGANYIVKRLAENDPAKA